MNFSKSLKLGSVSFAPNIFGIIYAVLGLLSLSTSPLVGLAFIAVGALTCSDWRHRTVAIFGIAMLTAILIQYWLAAAAIAVAGYLLHKKVPHRYAYIWWLSAAVMLFAGHFIFAIVAGAIGAYFWKNDNE
ncbi:MAG TPA: hypothetical protein EYN91_14940 [Candidatus Melainabacteria bacterium]|nr:hypothetical protein [Candidatus Melainabacteria bacterium]